MFVSYRDEEAVVQFLGVGGGFRSLGYIWGWILESGIIVMV